MSWLHSFEIVSYTVSAIALISLIRHQDYRTLFAFGSAALFGYTLELFSLSFFKHHSYNPSFWVSIGNEPYQFPFFGGIMWGLLMAYCIKIANKFNLSKLITFLFSGFILVTLDIPLDIIAIRLDGGFWTWIGVPADLSVTSKVLYGVPWRNYLGYFVVVPTIALLTLRTQRRVEEQDLKAQLLHMVLNYVFATVIFILALSVISWLGNITKGYFCMISFVLIYIFTMGAVVYKMTTSNLIISSQVTLGMTLFWAGIYLYTLSALIHLNLHVEAIGLFVFCFTSMLGTIFVSLVEAKSHLNNV